MSFKALYKHRQTLPSHIKRTELFKLAQDFSGKEAVLLCSGSIDPTVIRGMYLAVDDPIHPKYQ